MRLLYIVPSCNTEGGVARVLSVKTNSLIEKWGYDIHILTQNDGNTSPFYNFNSGIVFHDMILKGSVFQFFKDYINSLKLQISIIKPDIIIVCDNGLKAFTIPFFLNSNIPLVFECHGSKYIQENKMKASFFFKGIQFFKYKFKNLGAQKYKRFIALSNESLQEWDVLNYTIIPNPSWLKVTADNPLENKKVITVARNSYEKGLDRLLLIWQKTAVKHPDWILEIYGDDLKPLETVAEKLNINATVRFHKPVMNIEEKYNNASLFVMTSRFEGFPMVLIEAMASGLPCVAYDCPVGPRAIITNRENGILVPEGKEQLFVEQLSVLIEDAVLRRQLGKKARESVADYDLDIIMLQWNALFENIIKNN
ncbi:glycosyltransferase [Flavobacterium sp. WC2409]|jgi:glycosyltransferase involved in cell wall biosynthesis|uniref:Glycosyltransferase n=1 Tax=Flavobacterium sp. WC2409 TaxID=3234139 RepID=A0AB39W0T7_9FLAO